MRLNEKIYIVNEEGIKGAWLSGKYENGDWLAKFRDGRGIKIKAEDINNKISNNSIHNNINSAKAALSVVINELHSKAIKLSLDFKYFK